MSTPPFAPASSIVDPELTRCAACRFWSNHEDGHEGFCLSRAPRVIDRPLMVARWPETRAAEGCGEGVAGAGAVPQGCGSCRFWARPANGIDPGVRGDHVAAWWREAGWCRRHAPHPTFEAGAKAFWPVTHRSQGCFEGRPR